VGSIVIAIDGPAGSGKSTVARLIAQRLGFLYIDSGAIYRTCTLYVLESGVGVNDDAKRIADLLESASIVLHLSAEGTTVRLDGRIVTGAIRSSEVTSNVSRISAYPGVRELVNEKIRGLGLGQNSVVEGRDIGTVVFPDATVKVFMRASLKERARRRYQELVDSGSEVDLKAVEKDIERRDRLDSERETAPLKKADDALLLDTTDLTIEQAVDFIANKTAEIMAPPQLASLQKNS
jgi:cytidylate kinase